MAEVEGWNCWWSPLSRDSYRADEPPAQYSTLVVWDEGAHDESHTECLIASFVAMEAEAALERRPQRRALCCASIQLIRLRGFLNIENAGGCP